ncbi:MAG: TonB-dependent receptor plug domain-containing protein [Fermentimonas sp.]|jgi:TonB-dependent SusC/RagA subfamily outer membrane receptor
MKHSYRKTVYNNVCRFTVFLLFAVLSAGTFAAQASTEVRKDVTVHNVTVQQLVDNLSKQFDYSFFIVDENVAKTAVSVSKKNATINEILNEAFKNKDITYAIRGKSVTIASGVKTALEQANQKQKITGTITDESGEVIIGANVVEVGVPTNGTVSDVNGEFELNITPGASIDVSYIGYVPQRVTTAGKARLFVVLQEDTRALDEVVVIGYGTVAKRDLTGAVSSVSRRQFENQPVKRVQDILQGRTPGVEVTSLSGMPGGGVKVRIRGTTSINKSNNPLYIVDGVEGGSVNPMDIQSVEVLKDASSTAIYGSRGANGVVLITTRKGVAGKNQIVFDAQTGVSNFAKTYDVMDAYEYAQALNDIRGAGTISDADLQAYKNGTKGVNYPDLLFRTGITQDYKLGLSGGNAKAAVPGIGPGP